jgi:S-DNA-T family DNA segregation ATPase FtsK/SpoIIIE
VIVLSWLQTFLQKLKKEDEEELHEPLLTHDRPESMPILSKYETLKDLDARISYQYPKANSRRLAAPGKPPEEFLHQRRKKRITTKSSKQEQKETNPVQNEPPLAKKEQKPRIRGPFQPTEIPSPVFGFKRPEKTRTIVEHELSHFYTETDQDKGNSLMPVKESMEDSVQPHAEENVSVVPLHKETSVPLTGETEAVKEPEAPNTGSKEIPQAIEVAISERPNQAVEYREEDTLKQPAPQSPRRSHLPFNVMMLKQDKQLWEARIRKQEKAQKQTQMIHSERQKEAQKQTHLVHPGQQERVGINLRVESLPETRTEPETLTERNRQSISPGGYQFPEAGLLNPPVLEIKDTEWISEQKELLNQTLQNFNVGAQVVHVTQGPSVTRFEVQPDPGVKVNKITNLSDDIKLSLAARDIRIEAPIPGKHTIGIEVPNQKSRPVRISEIIQSPVFQTSASPLTAVLGLDIAGTPIVTDLKKMPHGLIAGATGSGKSVCINSILVSLLYKASPEDLKLLLIDPKMVELAPYNRIPHLVSPVITDVKAATAALKWAVDEMERRYELFAHTGVRDINRFNEWAVTHKRYTDKLPFIVIIIDELADLMMMSPADVEEAICRIAQKARACGIHLIVATQRPSVDVITGLIKANIPTRIAFSVSSQVDSRTIIDISGAEKLLGRGDMLFLENGSSKPVRLQGTFVTDEEIDLVVDHVRAQQEPEYLFEQEELLKKAQITEGEDELFYEACEFIIDQGGASTSSLQRRFKIGYNRAARLMDMLEQNGYITGANGSKPREVLITEADLAALQDSSIMS